MISIIAAIAENNVIGINNKLPWDLPEDLKHFQNITRGKTVLMGSNTFESIVSILGKPLPNRKNIVVTLKPNYTVPEGVVVYYDFYQAINELKQEDLFVIGGAQIWKLALPLADQLFITHVKGNFEGDTYFPTIEWRQWKKVEDEQHDKFSFAKYKRTEQALS